MAIIGQIDNLAFLYRTILNRAIWHVVFGGLISDSRNASADFRIGSCEAKLVEKYQFGSEENPFEAHQKFVDVHYCLVGHEQIDFAETQLLGTAKEYDPTNDVILLHPSRDYHTARMSPGRFAIFFPEDAHRPLQPMTPTDLHLGLIKKIVVKVPVEETTS